MFVRSLYFLGTIRAEFGLEMEYTTMVDVVLLPSVAGNVAAGGGITLQQWCYG